MRRQILGLLCICSAAVLSACPAPRPKCNVDADCTAGFSCDTATGACVDKCSGKECPAGQSCTVGDCKPNCKSASETFDGTTCTLPETCDQTTASCKNKCAAVTCTSPTTQVCNPSTGACDEKCAGKACSATQTCEATTGLCLSNCLNGTQHRNAAEACPAGQECNDRCKLTDTNCNQCRPICDRVGPTCGYGQRCDATTGTCKAGGLPQAGEFGAACTADTECTQTGNAASSQPTTCVTEDLASSFVGGYCLGACDAQGKCPAGGTPTTSITGDCQCIDACVKDAECRGEPYRCVPYFFRGGPACFPANECPDDAARNAGECESAVGDACNGDTQFCADGLSCLCFFDYNQTTGACSPEFTCTKLLTGADGATGGCPAGSMFVQESPLAGYCLKQCDAAQFDSCRAGYTCYPAALAGTPEDLCWLRSCDVDDQCNDAACDPNAQGGLASCGSGQQCQNGHCSTLDTCSTANPCDAQVPAALRRPCVNGVCQSFQCDDLVGECKIQCTDANKADVCRTGDACIAGHCRTHCNDDDGCGPNGVCEPISGQTGNFCEARCTKFNEADLCSENEVCVYDTGRCQAKCTSTSCGAEQICNSDGRCIAWCDATGAAACADGSVCDPSTHRCELKCTNTGSSESSLCAPRSMFCEVSTGLCKPACCDGTDCANDKGVCSAGLVCDASTKRCGQPCTTSCVSGTPSVQHKAPDGTPLVCDFGKCVKECSLATESAVCATGKFCNVSSKKCYTACESSTNCSGQLNAPVCCAAEEKTGRCVATAADCACAANTDCGGTTPECCLGGAANNGQCAASETACACTGDAGAGGANACATGVCCPTGSQFAGSCKATTPDCIVN
jgi:hypothetical protein